MYVNYGRLEDFLYLNRTLNLSLEGHVCIARYGEIFRGDKVVCRGLNVEFTTQIL